MTVDQLFCQLDWDKACLAWWLCQFVTNTCRQRAAISLPPKVTHCKECPFNQLRLQLIDRYLHTRILLARFHLSFDHLSAKVSRTASTFYSNDPFSVAYIACMLEASGECLKLFSKGRDA